MSRGTEKRSPKNLVAGMVEKFLTPVTRAETKRAAKTPFEGHAERPNAPQG